MSSYSNLRTAGKREFKAAKPKRNPKTTTPGPVDFLQGFVQAADGVVGGEVHVNGAQVESYHHVFHADATIRACREIILSGLEGGDLLLHRDDRSVKLTSTFSRFIQSTFKPLVPSILDSILVKGFVIMAICPVVEDGDGIHKVKEVVPSVVTHDHATLAVSTKHYQRRYRAVPTDATAYAETRRLLGDRECLFVFVKDAPDSSGNVSSPVACCFDHVAFGNELQSLALSAELQLTRTRVFAQSVPQGKGDNGLDGSNLLFDDSARDSARAQASDDNQARLDELRALSNLTSALNNASRSAVNSGLRPQVTAAHSSTVPLPDTPSLFMLPSSLQYSNASGAMPTPRSDLERQLRLVIERTCSAFSCPSELVFSSGFASRAAQQLRLLNSTISTIATFIGNVLTKVYNEIFEPTTKSLTTVSLSTKLLHDTNEVVTLYQSGLCSIDSASRVVASIMGLSQEELDAFLVEKKKELESANASLSGSHEQVDNADAKGEGSSQQPKDEQEKTKPAAETKDSDSESEDESESRPASVSGRKRRKA
jgi:hypothetical protein